MQENSTVDDEPDVVEQLHKIVERMLKPFDVTYRPPTKTLLGRSAPFDHSRPNEHGSKAEFQREMTIVEQSLVHLSELIGLLSHKDFEGELNRPEFVGDHQLK